MAGLRLKTGVNKLTLLSWVGTFFMIVPAYTITLVPDTALHMPVFFAFLTGHALLSAYTFIRKEWALFALNFNFVFVDMIGIYIRF